jgi:hypothetical protein
MDTKRQASGESILRGADGHVQGRKLAAWICFFLGIALLVQGTFIPASDGIQAKVVPAVVALFFSLLFWGLVTIQNVVQLVALLKGQNAGLEVDEQSAVARTKEAIDGQ